MLRKIKKELYNKKLIWNKIGEMDGMKEGRKWVRGDDLLTLLPQECFSHLEQKSERNQ
jgi:hypothetical protein